jgi:hypothetical protein
MAMNSVNQITEAVKYYKQKSYSAIKAVTYFTVHTNSLLPHVKHVDPYVNTNIGSQVLIQLHICSQV